MSDSSVTGPKNGVEKFKKFLCSRSGEIVVLILLSALALLFTVLYYSARFIELSDIPTERGDMSFWTADKFYISSDLQVSGLNIYFSVAFAVCVGLYALAWLLLIIKRKTLPFYFAAGYNIGLSAACMIVGSATNVMSGGTVALCIFCILFDVTALAYLIVRWRMAVIEKDLQATDGSGGNASSQPVRHKYKLALLICECVALAILATVLFIPVYSEGEYGASYILIQSIGANDYPVYISIGFVAMIIALFGEILFFISTVSDYFGAKTFALRSRHFVLSTTVFTLIFFILGYCLSFYYNLSGEEYEAAREAGTVSYIPFMLSVANMIVYSVFSGKIPVEADGHAHAYKPFKLEPLFAVLAMTAITFAALAVNIIEVHVEVPVASIERDVKLSGYELLTTYNELDSGFQLLAFIEFAFLLISGILLLLSIMSFVGKDRSYYKIIKVSALSNLFFVLLIGLFGIYFKIGQKINVESIESVLTYYGVTLPDVYEYEVKSNTIYMLIGSVAVIVYMICRKMFGLGAEYADHARAGTAARDDVGFSDSAAADASGAPTAANFDACPAFTEIDGLKGKFQNALETRRQHMFANPTLPGIARFVVDYARESRLHLSYTVEDMATFIAGLGASRLTILQGMSGTGKTSLPKIFTEALMSNCDIVEVESSWRDKNELLGFYNEFSKCFTPKKFTQCLYRARLNSAVITFIVLDEMNLSRIEYYFSDFLSLMENEPDRREIKLLNIKLARTENGQKISYDGLKDGHTIKIPANVWFIGTANRDESTFEISDKVYDRAQTMNFDKRAPKLQTNGKPLEQRFIPYGMLLKLFDDAKNSYSFDAEADRAICETEKLLAPYNISFGNRILRQMEEFVKIYCACFDNRAAAEADAVERILLSKVVRKLENKVVENKEALASQFDKLGLKKCSAFVRKLNED